MAISSDLLQGSPAPAAEEVRQPKARASGYLGPGRVLQPRGSGRVEVELEDARRVVVTLGLAFSYEPVVDDQLLIAGQAVAGQAEHFYAIGVLAGASRPGLAFQGDVDLHAVGGTLTLSGDEGVEVEGKELTLRADTLRTFAGSLTEKADEAYRWVKGLATLRAGESRRVIEGEDYNQSQDSIHLAKGTVKIDGHQVHMGH